MKLDRQKICTALDLIATFAPERPINTQSLSGLSADEQNILFSFLSFLGVVKDSEDQQILASDSAALCIRSISEFLRHGDVLIPVWNSRIHNLHEINQHNAFESANFLHLMESAREKIGKARSQLTPLINDTIVRAAITRRIWGKTYYLMQYDDRVGKYQLIGGRVLSGDATREEALSRKIREELPSIVEYIPNNNGVRCIFQSERADEEIFVSEKFGVLAQYKSFIYELHLRNVTPKLLHDIAENKANRWISMKEIEKEKARDGKAVFKLAPTAITKLKEMESTIKVAQHDIDIFLELTWVKIVLAIAGVTGLIPIIQGLLKLFSKFF